MSGATRSGRLKNTCSLPGRPGAGPSSCRRCRRPTENRCTEPGHRQSRARLMYMLNIYVCQAPDRRAARSRPVREARFPLRGLGIWAFCLPRNLAPGGLALSINQRHLSLRRSNKLIDVRIPSHDPGARLLAPEPHRSPQSDDPSKQLFGGRNAVSSAVSLSRHDVDLRACCYDTDAQNVA